MRIAYFDCFSGAAGDMILSALLDAGLPLETLQSAVRALKLAEVSLHPQRVKRHGLSATRLEVRVDPAAPKKHRHLSHIVRIIDETGLPARVADRAKAIFGRLAAAEARVHDTTVEKVHFHEVGAADAIVDIVGACVGLDHLGVERLMCSPIPTGSGTVRCEHGVMPVPAPATAELLRGVPLAACDEPGELTTPTGAAILTALSSGYGTLPNMSLRAIGVGTGSREGTTRPNLLRVLIGDSTTAENAESDTVLVLEAHVDDCTGQVLGHACQLLLARGALDAYIVPIQMKKGRPGHLLTLLCRPEDAPALEQIVFAETSTFGVRRHECARTKLDRGHVQVETRYGPIRVKVGRRGDTVLQAWPESDDCAAAAQARGVALRTVQQAALAEWVRRHDPDVADHS